ncbi:AarF/ABC1/UbiB kinase family protein [Synechocystis sp. FACHB-383]|uniref:ABC1 kinase family protein n=1 Tax=Synechocystis sp. FACHB-383 TaxID=2692864 RepID=UPI0016886F47|nr:AarF/ABC1/UbiB kinase family protein [Synechocystis sp. FACHB-383]MBD2652537.1 AarF/ABC1/UbiB kinase family protein [Synechocystis sp. FACHB-383]
MMVISQPVADRPLSWSGLSRKPWRRQLAVTRVFLSFVFFLWWDRLTAPQSAQRRYRRAQWLVQQLLYLGPTFIKIGQSLSTRADIIPAEYIQAFTQLQDRVPPFDSRQAIAVIEEELHGAIDEVFQQFEVTPLASASLGQVHRAVLPTGEAVVVKVQRPGLDSLLNLDFELLHQTLRLAKRWLPGFRNLAQKYEVEAIYQEFFSLLFLEIDYIHEGKNAERFRQNFADYPRVRVPEIYWQYTTRMVLTLEYLPGIKVDDRQALETAGIDLDLVIQTGICAYLKQLLIDGFFQSDPHPGNMAVDSQGDLIFYDFGTMAEVKIIAKDQMIQTFFAVLKKDANQVLEALIYMGLVEPKGDLSPVKRIINFLLDNFRDKPIDIKAFDQVGEEVYAMFQQQPFRLPPQMTFILKSISTLDGIARALDPRYNLIAASQPFIQSVTVAQPKRSLAMALVQQVKQFALDQLNRPSRNQQFLQELTAKLERGELQFATRSPEGDRLLRKIHLALKSLIFACLTGFTLLSATVLLSTVYARFAVIGFGLAGLFSLFLLRSLIKLAVQERLDRLVQKR